MNTSTYQTEHVIQEVNAPTCQTEHDILEVNTPTCQTEHVMQKVNVPTCQTEHVKPKVNSPTCQTEHSIHSRNCLPFRSTWVQTRFLVGFALLNLWFCGSLMVSLYFSFWPMFCLFFFDVRIHFNFTKRNPWSSWFLVSSNPLSRKSC
jgi:hypothetical protein